MQFAVHFCSYGANSALPCHIELYFNTIGNSRPVRSMHAQELHVWLLSESITSTLVHGVLFRAISQTIVQVVFQCPHLVGERFCRRGSHHFGPPNLQTPSLH